MALRNLFLTISAAALLMAGIGTMYKCRQAHEPVWHSQARTWAKVPLVVGWEPSSHGESYAAAVDVINERVGCKLLRVSLTEKPDVRIVEGDLSACGVDTGVVIDPDDAAQAYLCPDGTAEIHVNYPGDITMSYLIAYHEFGHVLGLAHDGTYSDEAMFVSIMTPAVTAHSARLEGGKALPMLSDKDTKALGYRYCGAKK